MTPFIAIRQEAEGGDFDRTMAEYLVNPLDEELRDVRVTSSGTFSDPEEGVVTATAPENRFAAVAPHSAVRIGMTTTDEYREMNVGWTVGYETPAGRRSLRLSLGKGFRDAQHVDDVPEIGGPAICIGLATPPSG